jgi:hypothetical protein
MNFTTRLRNNKKKLGWLLTYITIIVLSFFISPYLDNGVEICSMKLLTGLPCPGCGLTHSFCAVSSGNFTDAFRFHFFGPFIYIAVLIFIFVLFSEIFLDKKFPKLRRIFFSKSFTYAFGIILFLFFSFRLYNLVLTGEFTKLLHNSVILKIIH